MVKTVLLIDDDTDDQLLFSMIMKEINPDIRCEIVSNGEEGIEALEKGPEPSIIFLDLNMPQMNGFEFLESFRSKDLRSPVVVLTTSSDPHDIEKSGNLGAKGFLPKPTDFIRFRENIQKVLDFDFSVPRGGIVVF